MTFLHVTFPERMLEVQLVAEDGEILEAFGTDYVDGFDAKLEELSQNLLAGQQLISFRNSVPTYVVELDCDGNEVTERIPA